MDTATTQQQSSPSQHELRSVSLITANAGSSCASGHAVEQGMATLAYLIFAVCSLPCPLRGRGPG
jgi:hypothetical protein